MLNASKPSRPSSRCRGVSLVEVVVASALLVIGVVPVLRALTSAQVTAHRMAVTSQSLVLAQGRLEWIRARAQGDYDQSFAVDSEDCGGGYRVTATDHRRTGVRTVKVSVGYDRDENQVLSNDEVRVSLITCIAQHGAGGSSW